MVATLVEGSQQQGRLVVFVLPFLHLGVIDRLLDFTTAAEKPQHLARKYQREKCRERDEYKGCPGCHDRSKIALSLYSTVGIKYERTGTKTARPMSYKGTFARKTE